MQDLIQKMNDLLNTAVLKIKNAEELREKLESEKRLIDYTKADLCARDASLKELKASLDKRLEHADAIEAVEGLKRSLLDKSRALEAKIKAIDDEKASFEKFKDAEIATIEAKKDKLARQFAELEAAKKSYRDDVLRDLEKEMKTSGKV